MSTYRTPIDRATAERLLDGVGAGSGSAPTDPGHQSLAALLTAAAAPARGGELAGAAVALAEFRVARLAPVPRPRRLSMIKTAVLKILTVKVTLAAVTIAGAGGLALAATTGALPVTGRAHGAATPQTDPHGATPSGDKEKPANPHRTADPKGPKPDSSHTPNPSIIGLCRAYNSGNKSEHGKALENPAFSTLVAAAGGKDKVGAYCQLVLAAAASDKSTKKPNPNPTHPTNPGGGRNDQPHGKPTSPPLR